MDAKEALTAKIARLQVDLNNAESQLNIAKAEKVKEEIGVTAPTQLVGSHVAMLEKVAAQLPDQEEALMFRTLLGQVVGLINKEEEENQMP
eukprot:2730800-Karenia_brevis.AAC.1